MEYLKRLELKPLVIAIANQKGGGGKTTTTLNLGMGLYKRKIKVLMIDSDSPQRSLVKWHESRQELGLECLVPCIGITGNTLQSDLLAVGAGYHVILIDCGAGISKSSAIAIRCADVVLIPVMPSSLDLDATAETVNLIMARRDITGGTPQAAFVINGAKKNTVMASQIEPALKEEYSIPVLRSRTSNHELYRRSYSEGKSIFCDGESLTASEFNSLIEEVIAMYISRSPNI